MNYRVLKTGIAFLLLMLPMFLMASATGDDAGSTLSFFKGDGAIEKWFLNAFKSTEANIESHANQAAALGRAIGAIGALMYLGWLGWQMQEGARPWEVTPMIRPIIIGLILSNWVGFTSIIKKPLELIATPSIAMFNDIERESDALRIKRYELQMKIVDKALELDAKNRVKDNELNKNKDLNALEKFVDQIGTKVGDAFYDMKVEIKKFELKTEGKLQILFAEIIEGIGLIILRVCVYGIFGIQKIWSFVLMIVGPIAVGLALIPGFENAMQSWIAKFININLYSFVAHTSMSIGHILISSAYKMEIQRYETLLKGTEEVVLANVMQYVGGAGAINLIIITVVAYIVTGVMVLMTPTIADSIVSAGGTGIASKMKQGVATIASAGQNIAKQVGKQTTKTGATPKF